jgi:hypothetical protein
METFRNKKWLRLHFSIPEEMINQFYTGRSPGFASFSDSLPMRMHSGFESSSASQLRGQRRYCTELPY